MTPAETVRESLTASRAAGLDFDAAWLAALALVPAVDRESTSWRTVILGSRTTWRRAYLRVPPNRTDRRAHGLSALVAR